MRNFGNLKKLGCVILTCLCFGIMGCAAISQNNGDNLNNNSAPTGSAAETLTEEQDDLSVTGKDGKDFFPATSTFAVTPTGTLIPTAAFTPAPTFNATPTPAPIPTQAALFTPTPTFTVNTTPAPIPTQAAPFTPTPTTNPIGTPTPTFTLTPTPDTVTITMVGDILLHDRIEADCLTESGTYDYTGIFKNTKEYISSFDIAIVNQEVIIGGRELGISGYPRFNADFTLADAIYDAGFDVVLHATNHMLDKGKTGILNSLNNWKRFPDIKVIGIYESEEEYENQILYIEKNGIKIAILNFSYGTNGQKIPGDAAYVAGPLLKNPKDADYEENLKKITALLDTARENSDFVIVCPHWGEQYSLKQGTYQKKWNRIFYEHGVDLVLGCHPHVIQPIVVVDSEITTNINKIIFDDMTKKTIPADEMLVYYSTGNFVNWTGDLGEGILNRMVGGMPEIRLKRNENGDVVIKDFGVTAIVSHVETGKQKVTVYKFNDYTEELAYANEIKNSAGCEFTLSFCEELLNTVWGNYWK